MAVDDGKKEHMWELPAKDLVLLGARIEPEAKKKLQIMADRDKRSMAMQVEYLIEKMFETHYDERLDDELD